MFGQKPDKPAMSGMEVMLRSMGLGEALDGVKELAQNGTLAKIVAFAERAEGIEQELREIKDAIRNLARESGAPGRAAGTEPGPSPADGGPVKPFSRLVDGSAGSQPDGGHVHTGGSASPGVAGLSAGDGNANCS